MITAFILLTTIAGLGTPAAMILFPWTLITGSADALYDVSQWIVRTALRLARIRVDIIGRDRVPAGAACIFMSNHISNLDPPALIPNLPGRTSAFLKQSLMRLPVLGYGFRLGEFVPVDRDGSVENAKESVNAARRVLESGIHIRDICGRNTLA